MTLECGEDKTAGEVATMFFEAVDDPFLGNVIEVKAVHGENDGVAPANLSFVTDSDPSAMVIEAEYMAESVFNRASACVVPTEEQLDAMMGDS